MPNKTKHVVRAPGGTWTVKREGADRASKRFATQSEAIEWARDKSRLEGSVVVIHKRDGTIRQKESYGTEPEARTRKRAGLMHRKAPYGNDPGIKSPKRDGTTRQKGSSATERGIKVQRDKSHAKEMDNFVFRSHLLARARGIAHALATARAKRSVHGNGPAGTIRDKDSYGDDPKTRRNPSRHEL